MSARVPTTGPGQVHDCSHARIEVHTLFLAVIRHDEWQEHVHSLPSNLDGGSGSTQVVA